MHVLNLHAVWVGILCGCLSGAILGLFFHNEKWMGGFGSWERRMMRLGHISFFGIALINFIYASSIELFKVELTSPVSSYLLVMGAITMPTVCFLSVYKKNFRHLFFIPVLSLITGTTIYLIQHITVLKGVIK